MCVLTAGFVFKLSRIFVCTLHVLSFFSLLHYVGIAKTWSGIFFNYQLGQVFEKRKYWAMLFFDFFFAKQTYSPPHLGHVNIQ